MDFTATDVNS